MVPGVCGEHALLRFLSSCHRWASSRVGGSYHTHLPEDAESAKAAENAVEAFSLQFLVK